MPHTAILSAVSTTELAGTLVEATVNFHIGNFSYRKFMTEPMHSLPVTNEELHLDNYEGSWYLKVIPLHMYAPKMGDVPVAHVKVQVCFQTQRDESIPASFVISIVDLAEQPIFSCQPQHEIKLFGPERTSSWGYPDFISHDVLFNPKRNYLLNDTLRLQARIKFLASPGRLQGRVTPSPSSDTLATLQDACIASLLKDLTDLYYTKTGTDCTLVSTDRIEHAVHTSLLGARSRKFRTLLLDTRENGAPAGKVYVPDLNWEILDILLEYLYTASIERIPAKAEGLLVAADMYEIPCLKRVCEYYLIRSVNKDNAKMRLKLADECGAGELKAAAMEVIAEVLEGEHGGRSKDEIIDHLFAYLGPYLNGETSAAKRDHLSPQSDYSTGSSTHL